METGLFIFIIVMIAAAIAEIFISLYYRPERVLIFPVTKEVHIDSFAASEILSISKRTQVYLVNMGAELTEWEKFEAIAAQSENVFCMDEADILTYL